MKKTLLTLTAVAVAASAANAQLLFSLADTDDVSLSHSTSAPTAAPPQSGNVALGNGAFSWGTLASDSGGNTATFSGGTFQSADWGGLGTFTSNSINVTSLSFADIAGDYSGSFNTDTEFSNFFYSLDGGTPVEFGQGVEDATATNQAVGITGIDLAGATSMVVGFSFSHNGGSDSFDVGSLTVTAVPEPSTYALGILGLVALMVFARRRRRLAE